MFARSLEDLLRREYSLADRLRRPYSLTVAVKNTGSISASISHVAVEFPSNGTVIYAYRLPRPITISPWGAATINYDNCTSSSLPPPGTQVAVVVVTTNGLLAQYTTTWP